MALAERTMNGAGFRFSDLVESLSYELFAEWTSARPG
jgi:hypothetical protein